MTTEEKFNAAVNVIRSLPKNGSFQPSYDMMLRFYAYFKQATQGPCTVEKPGFWDIPGRAKYQAWKNLGNMPKSEAMARYVDELHTIVETMSYSDNVASFLDAPTTELDSLRMEDLQLVVGDVIERVRSQPNSPLDSREASPSRLISSLSNSSRSVSPDPEESDYSDGEYVDTIETLDPKSNHTRNIPDETIITNGCANPQLSNGYIGHKSRSKTRSNLQVQPVDISQEIAKAVQSIKADIDQLTNKVNTLERTRVVKSKTQIRIPFSLVAFIIAWPFVANFIMIKVFRKRT